MKEYIERAALKRELAPYEENDFSQQMDVILAIVDAQPAADVVEVRHGRWVPEVHHTYLPVEYDDAGYPALHEYISYRCSLCGREEAKKEPYCHCGARMDKGDEHEAD